MKLIYFVFTALCYFMQMKEWQEVKREWKEPTSCSVVAIFAGVRSR